MTRSTRTPTPDGDRVVVGYDGSADAEQAVRLGQERARRLGLVLELVGAVDRWRSALWHGQEAEHEAEVAAHERLDRLAALLQGGDPGLRVRVHVGHGPAVPVLLERAAGAESVIVGARGNGGFTGLRLGHTGAQLSAHVACPVLVTSGGGGRGVVVGVTGGAEGVPDAPGDAALRFAFAEAEARGEPLLALQAWQPAWVDLHPLAGAPIAAPGYPEAAQDRWEQVHEQLQRRLAPLCAEHPGVATEVALRPLHPVAALAEAGQGRRTIVVGSHGAGTLSGLLLGSVSRGLLERASTTVAVVRAAADDASA